MIPVGEFMPTPKFLPSVPLACFYLNLFKTSTESKPALSAMVLGITSKALANEFKIN